MSEIDLQHITEISRQICIDYKIKLEDLASKRRVNKVNVLPRQIIWALVRDTYGFRISLQELGNMYGKDHATVLHGCKVVSNLCDTDRHFKARYDTLLAYAKMKRAEKPLKHSHTVIGKLTEALTYQDISNIKICLRQLISALHSQTAVSQTFRLN